MKRVKTVGSSITAFLVILAMLACLVPMRVLAADPASTTTFTFTDSGITASGTESGYKISGTALTINESGTYTVTGSCAEGSITVKKGTTGVTLVLKDLDLSASTTAPLSCNKGTETTLYISGTVTLNDNESLANEDSDDFEGAAVKVKSEGSVLTITGTGTLHVNGNCKNGIKGAATATVAVTGGVTLNVTAVNNGIACDNLVQISGSTVNVTAGNDGIKAEPDEDDADSAGMVSITGGSVNVSAQGDGIQATNDVNITGGTLSITTFGGYAKAKSLGSDDSAKGIKADGQVYITGGTFTLDCADDAIHANNTVTVTGGTFTIRTGDDGMHADYDLILGSSSGGPDVTIAASYEGLEGATITLNGGSGDITASDDGVNAATDASVSEIALYINGGVWTVNAGGDGLDAGGDSRNNSGGNIYVNGGVMEVYGAADNGNAALDFDGSMTYKSGTLLAVGMSGMAQAPTSGTYVAFGQVSTMGGPGMGGGMRFSDGESGSAESDTVSAPGGGMGGQPGGGMGGQPGSGMSQGTGSISLTSGSAITITDASGNTVYSATARKNANSVVFCSDQVTSGSSYTLNGSVTATASGSQSGQSGTGKQPGSMTDTPSTPTPSGSGDSGSGDSTDTGTDTDAGTGTDSDSGTDFTDVSKDAWYAPAVDYVNRNGMMTGTGSGSFTPEGKLSRAQTAQILYNIAGGGAKTGSIGFSDVADGKWYADAVNWAAQAGYVQGSGGSFRPDDNITREQLVTILYRFAGDQNLGSDRKADLSRYSDAGQISAYASEAMAWAVGNGVITGATGTTLAPQGTATRAQMAQILQNFSQLR